MNILSGYIRLTFAGTAAMLAYDTWSGQTALLVHLIEPGHTIFERVAYWSPLKGYQSVDDL